MRKIPVEAHFDPEWDRWVLIWKSGGRKGLRVEWEEMGLLGSTGFWSHVECDGDDQYVFTEDPVTGERCDFVDYTLRFFSKDGADFFVYQIEQHRAAMARAYRRLKRVKDDLDIEDRTAPGDRP